MQLRPFSGSRGDDSEEPTSLVCTFSILVSFRMPFFPNTPILLGCGGGIFDAVCFFVANDDKVALLVAPSGIPKNTNGLSWLSPSLNLSIPVAGCCRVAALLSMLFCGNRLACCGGEVEIMALSLEATLFDKSRSGCPFRSPWRMPEVDDIKGAVSESDENR